MSMIGNFGLCSKGVYNQLAEQIQKGQLTEAGLLIQKMQEELMRTEQELNNNIRSGEVFLALYDYLQTAFGVDVRQAGGFLGEEWRSSTGDWDMVVFANPEEILLLESRMDYPAISRAVSAFFEADYGNAGELACAALLDNLKKTDNERLLIWRLF